MLMDFTQHSEEANQSQVDILVYVILIKNFYMIVSRNRQDYP